MSEKLREEITKLSFHNKWADVKEEWIMTNRTHGMYRCICDHPITNQHHLMNGMNLKETIVGSCCIKQFTSATLDRSKRLLDLKKKKPDNHYEVCDACKKIINMAKKHKCLKATYEHLQNKEQKDWEEIQDFVRTIL